MSLPCRAVCNCWRRENPCSMQASHSSCSIFKIAGMLVAVGGRGLTIVCPESKFQIIKRKLPLAKKTPNIGKNILPLISTNCSKVSGCPLIGSAPFSLMYFSTNLFSKTAPLAGETTGCSGTSLLTKAKGHCPYKRTIGEP